MACAGQTGSSKRATTGERRRRFATRGGFSKTTSVFSEAQVTLHLNSESPTLPSCSGFENTTLKDEPSQKHEKLNIGGLLERITLCGTSAENLTRDGKAVSHLNGKNSTQAKSGGKRAFLCGNAITQHVVDAVYTGTTARTCRSTYITLFRFQIKIFARTQKTSFFCAKHATILFIRGGM